MYIVMFPNYLPGVGLGGPTAYVAAEGSWPGCTAPISVGSISGINGDAGGNRKLDVGGL